MRGAQCIYKLIANHWLNDYPTLEKLWPRLYLFQCEQTCKEGVTVKAYETVEVKSYSLCALDIIMPCFCLCCDAADLSAYGNFCI